jgi:tetratricopeptide (TPR) repeat protein
MGTLLRRLVGLALVGMGFFAAEPASADPPSDPAPEPKVADRCRCEPALTQPGPLFDNGARCFRAGELDAALACFERAYSLDPNPTLIYNIARSHEGKGALPEAVEAYERYLVERPDADDRGAVEKKLQVLRAQIEAAERPPPAPQPPPPAPPSDPAVIPWVVAGVGIAAVGVGVGFVIVSSGQKSDAIAEPEAFAAQSLADDAGTSLTVGSVALIAGGALALAGGIWGTIDLVTLDEGTEVSWHVRPGGVACSGRF